MYETSQAQSQFYTRVFTVVALAILCALLWQILKPLATTLAWTLLLAFLLHPVQARFTRWLRGRAAVAALLLTFAMLLLLVGPLAALGVALAHQATTLLDQLQASYGPLRDMGQEGSLQDIPVLGSALSWIEHNTMLTGAQLREWLVNGSRYLLDHLGAVGGSLFIGALGTVAGFLMMLFLLFFFLRDGAQMKARLAALLPISEAHKQALVSELGAVTRAVVFGTLLTGLLQGALLGIGFALVQLPSPVVFAVVAALLSLLPIGGTALVWIPAVLYLLAQGRYGAAIFLTVWGAVLVGLMDNFLKPFLISGRAEMPTLAVFLGVIGGLTAFGPIGMFLGPVLLAMTNVLLRWAEERRSERT